MKHLSFCPKCGHQSLIWDGEKKWSCNDCDHVMYHNCAGAVAVIIRYKDEVLLTRRNQEPKKGKLDLSGGFVDPRESAEETCRRELKEELDIDINPSLLEYKTSLPNTYLYKDINYNTLDLFYEYKVDEKFEVTLELSEVSDYVWVKKEDINIDDIAFDSQKQFFKNY